MAFDAVTIALDKTVAEFSPTSARKLLLELIRISARISAVKGDHNLKGAAIG